MIEMMFDLETLDVKSSALVLSVGAVIFETLPAETGNYYVIRDRFYRVLDMERQFMIGRTVSQATLLWWMQQCQDARDEAFAPVRHNVYRVMDELQDFVDAHDVTTRDFSTVKIDTPPVETVQKINKFWASPVSFDFGIWDSLADDMSHSTPWRYNNVFDVRTVVNEASYPAKNHRLTRKVSGLAHMPVYDCEWQIDELHAARAKIGRRVAK